jgi:indolepyruvate ferredoxin oxidoreductase beta subunit
MKSQINFLLAGVGGQGTVMASDLLVNVGLAAGFQAKQAEVHGMSQRGGSVISHVRWGKVVYSPLIGAGEVDVYLAFEKLEALRHLSKVRRGALVLVNMEKIIPVSMNPNEIPYPADEKVKEIISQVTNQAVFIDAAVIASDLGNVRVANVVLLGALSGLLENQGWVVPQLTQEIWFNTISNFVPQKHLSVNQLAFITGRDRVKIPA